VGDRYTPCENGTNKSIKNRVYRGVYTSGRKAETPLEQQYDLVKEFKPTSSHPTQAEYYDCTNLQTLDLDSNFEKDDRTTDLNGSSPKDTTDDDDDKPAKMSKLADDESVYNLDDSINDLSMYSMESFTNSARKIRRENDSDDVYGYVKATKGKKIDNKDWIKESKSGRLLRGLTRFFSKPKYFCGCIDDFNFKCCESAARWVVKVEGMSKERIPPKYYEDEYKMLYNEVHYRVSSTANLHSSDETMQHLESRRVTIEQNKTQILKDLNRTFTQSAEFGEGTDGRKQLMNTLEVISLKYTSIGYVQGMNYIVAGILYHASPTVTLGLMSHLLEDYEYQLCDIYAENLIGVHHHNKQLVMLLAKHLPVLDKHMKEFDISLEIFTTNWVIDLFSHIIPLADYKLFLNSFFNKGIEFFYRLVLTVLDQMSPEILEM
jgi:hypothetical protein